MSRVKNSEKNIRYAIINNFVNMILQFVLRTIFITTIGITFLGIKGLYTNILSVLSLAELGFGTAMIYSMYKPVAENDKEKIKSLLVLYRNAFRIIAIIITIAGLILLPFLPSIVKDPGDISNAELMIYYLFFLFNTISTYFISYKYNLLYAYQKKYIVTNSLTLLNVFTSLLQIIFLIIYKSFLVFLIIGSLMQLIHKILVNIYINKKIPFLKEKNVNSLPDIEKNEIKKNIFALVLHKIGAISVHQTDNIIISSFISISMVGILSNYNLIIVSIATMINIIFNSLINSLGNYIATQNLEKQFYIFKVYRFVSFWLYGFSTIAFFILLNPFITLWIGSSYLLPDLIVWLILIDFYMKGERLIINNYKSASGIFRQDMYIPIIQGVINLIVSIVLVVHLGLIGVFIGTLLSGLVANIFKPIILYKSKFLQSSMSYFKESFKYIILLFTPLFILLLIKTAFLKDVSIFNFSLLVILTAIIPNIIFILILHKSDEFKYIYKYFKAKIPTKNIS